MSETTNEPKRRSRPLPNLQPEIGQNGLPPKKRKQKRTSRRISEPMGISKQAEEVKGDILVVDNELGTAPTLPQSTVTSQPSKYLYLQNKDKFKTVGRQQFAERKSSRRASIQRRRSYLTTQNDGINDAINLHNNFQMVTTFLQSILAGIAIWQIVTIYTYNLDSKQALINSMQASSKYVSIIYHVCLVFSTVSLIDRITFSGLTMSQFVRELLKPSTPALILSLIALTTSLANFAGDMCIGNYSSSMSLNFTGHNIFNPDVRFCNVSTTWKRLNLTRCVTAILIWVFASLCQNDDSLKTRLVLISDKNN